MTRRGLSFVKYGQNTQEKKFAWKLAWLPTALKAYGHPTAPSVAEARPAGNRWAGETPAASPWGPCTGGGWGDSPRRPEQADGLFWEGCHQEIIPSLLSVNAVQPEPALSHNKPTSRLVHPKGRKTEATQAVNSRRSGEIYQVLLVHAHRGHQCRNAPSEYYSGQVKTDLFHYIISCRLLTTVLADFLAQELAHLGPTIAASTFLC
jgi:hypothetical protein